MNARQLNYDDTDLMNQNRPGLLTEREVRDILQENKSLKSSVNILRKEIKNWKAGFVVMSVCAAAALAALLIFVFKDFLIFI